MELPEHPRRTQAHRPGVRPRRRGARDLRQDGAQRLAGTETALSDYANELDRRNALKNAADQSAEAARLAQLRFDAGSDSFLTLLDAQRSQAQADAAFASSEAATVSKQVTLFKAPRRRLA
ncbi:MAG: TolC family protein [Alphaproteobacteria bacterium]